jgi:mono/diheme cytochrome c family protein
MEPPAACYTFATPELKTNRAGEFQMKLGIFALVLGLGMLLVTGCNKPSNESASNAPTATPAAKATATPDEFAFARANYAKHCSACHGDEGKGGVVKTPDGTKLKVPSLTEGHALKHADDDFVDQITNGGHGMPKFKDKLSPEEINQMVRFIRHEFQGK